MDLILWRHAEAAAATEQISDLQRRLTPRGDKQARAVGRWLRQHQPKPMRILVSPALRCQQTAHALAQPFDVDRRLAPDADVADLLAAAAWPEGSKVGARASASTVLLVGHQPALGRLAALLLSGQEAEWSIKKGGLWWFSRRRREAEAQTSLRAVIHPEFL